MPVTLPVTVSVPRARVDRISVGKDEIKVRFAIGSPTVASAIQKLPANTRRREWIAVISSVEDDRRDLDEAALHEFLYAREPERIAALVQKYGPLTLNDPLAMDVRRGEATLPIAEFRGERERLVALLGISTNLRDGDTSSAMEKAKVLDLPCADDPQLALSIQLSSRLLWESKLMLVARNKTLAPVLYCHSLIAGLYGLFLKSVLAGMPWSVCLNCGEPFVVDRHGKQFCTIPCQQSFKQRRYREQLAKRGSKRPRKN